MENLKISVFTYIIAILALIVLPVFLTFFMKNHLSEGFSPSKTWINKIKRCATVKYIGANSFYNKAFYDQSISALIAGSFIGELIEM